MTAAEFRINVRTQRWLTLSLRTLVLLAKWRLLPCSCAVWIGRRLIPHGIIVNGKKLRRRK